jgi:hypothetical protein
MKGKREKEERKLKAKGCERSRNHCVVTAVKLPCSGGFLGSLTLFDEKSYICHCFSYNFSCQKFISLLIYLLF